MPTASAPPGESRRTRVSPNRNHAHCAAATDEEGDRPRQEHLAELLVALDRRHRADPLGERLARGDRDGHEHEHDQCPERRHDPEATPRGRPECAEEQREYRERCEHDHRVHDERVERETRHLEHVLGSDSGDVRSIHGEDTMQPPDRFTVAAE
ncbi:hypothetical protein QFZ26_000410 [Agromyces ramosus]|uniref:Uncharacterized protein n=1 Tax=Agromyces ramosus TaxID=33879 RepID=A0ABU0R447_9MICO|nr:hypothetical protein [Agromyces ramosus]